MKNKMTVLVAAFVCGLCAFADITVSDVQVFSGYPWKEVVVGYTITGTSDETPTVGLTAKDRAANKTYAAKTLSGAEVTEGRHVMRWNAAADGVKFSSKIVVFTVSLVTGGVQLWENGPYWAECNVGATRPSEHGYYFWWGDTVGYKRNAADNGWISVKDGSDFSFLESNCPTHDKSQSELQSAGYIDSTGNLVAAHDAATAHLGAAWRMPTAEEIDALISNCTVRWQFDGMRVTGKGAFASKSIFLPAAGYGFKSDIYEDVGGKEEGAGRYWSSMSNSYYLGGTYWLSFYWHTDSFKLSSARCSYWGYSVRPLRGIVK